MLFNILKAAETNRPWKQSQLMTNWTWLSLISTPSSSGKLKGTMSLLKKCNKQVDWLLTTLGLFFTGTRKYFHFNGTSIFRRCMSGINSRVRGAIEFPFGMMWSRPRQCSNIPHFRRQEAKVSKTLPLLKAEKMQISFGDCLLEVNWYSFYVTPAWLCDCWMNLSHESYL